MRFVKQVIAGCLLATVFLTACEQDQTMNATDQDFLIKAAYGNLAEIDGGTLASTKGQADPVRMHASMMVQDHLKAHAELVVLATQRTVSLPTSPNAEHQALKQVLQSLSGRAFDTTYMNSQIADHKKSIANYENEVSNGNDQALKNFANGKLPTLRSHLAMAESIRKGL